MATGEGKAHGRATAASRSGDIGLCCRRPGFEGAAPLLLRFDGLPPGFAEKHRPKQLPRLLHGASPQAADTYFAPSQEFAPSRLVDRPDCRSVRYGDLPERFASGISASCGQCVSVFWALARPDLGSAPPPCVDGLVSVAAATWRDNPASASLIGPRTDSNPFTCIPQRL